MDGYIATLLASTGVYIITQNALDKYFESKRIRLLNNLSTQTNEMREITNKLEKNLEN